MIRELSIKNLALIENLSLSFESGLSVFTGETGTGKSILIGAIGLLLGERANVESIRSDSEEAEVCGVFDLTGVKSTILKHLHNHGIPSDGNELIIRRLLTKSGKNRVFVNQTPVPLATLKTIGDLLIDLHGQHDHQSLLNPETPFFLIDSFTLAKTAKNDYDKAYSNFVKSRKMLEEIEYRAAKIRERRDITEFQYNEISGLSLKMDEEESLEKELELLSSSTERIMLVSEINSVLNSDNNSPFFAIKRILKNLKALSKYDKRAETWISEIESIAAITTELESFCGNYLNVNESESAPEKLQKINERLAKIQRLKKKYQCSYSDLLQKETHLKQEIDDIGNSTSDIELQEKHFLTQKHNCQKKAEELSTVRQNIACDFDFKISKLMSKIGFSGGGWKTLFSKRELLSPTGIDEIIFLVCTNPGEPFLPLSKIASGGEISRLMLAVKTILAEHDSIPILIFDEIDTGIGGMLAKSVAETIYRLSSTHQVICISHLHQIASEADHHYVVYKKSQGRRTETLAKKLNENEKIGEIARMLGDTSDLSHLHAKEILKNKDRKMV